MDHEDLARRYLEHYAAHYSADRAAPLADDDDLEPSASDFVWEIVDRGGDDAWPLVLALVDLAPDDGALGFVAAGALEDLMVKHLGRFAERLIDQARRNARLVEALKGVWGWENFDPAIRRRLFAVMGVDTKLVEEWEAGLPRPGKPTKGFRGNPRRANPSRRR